ncbi:DUF3945 domain-containing protein [Niabella sp. W65]|nr:DUF3945 domain-containing protein [Niabella sp. W65]MCH7363959.1 DUF3945 domain-containing protein [Niabella sp. W65]
MEKIAAELQKHIDHPSKEGEAVLNKHEIKSSESQNIKNNTVMETSTTVQQPSQASEYRYQPEQIDWETLSKMGLSKEYLEKKKNLLDPLLKGYKTNELVPVRTNLGTAEIQTDARLSLRQNENGKVVMAVHGIRKQPSLDFPFFGHEFTKEDKANLLSTGNMGRVVDLTNPKTGEKIPSIISIDRLTNEVVALRQEWMKIPDEFKGITLNAEQKQTLLDGKPLYLEGMISKKKNLSTLPCNTMQISVIRNFFMTRTSLTGKPKIRPSSKGLRMKHHEHSGAKILTMSNM